MSNTPVITAYQVSESDDSFRVYLMAGGMDVYIDLDKSTLNNVGGTFTLGSPPANAILPEAIRAVKNHKAK